MIATQKAQAKLTEWQARAICTWIGLQAPVDRDKHGGRNPLVDAAQDLNVFGKSDRQRELEKVAGEQVAADWHDDPRLHAQAADPAQGVEASNPEGSFEAFIRMFGGPPVPPPAANGSGDG